MPNRLGSRGDWMRDRSNSSHQMLLRVRVGSGSTVVQIMGRVTGQIFLKRFDRELFIVVILPSY